ncbi:hypothetical protein ACH5RR_008245 [Cinchona calisaya]|uniref:Uncharacterized protein n=1 Tax=Cinchona calisaya TaxID=153742 RepID=A0ABD3ACP9_9GENT
MDSNSALKSDFDENDWVVRISRNLDEELEEEIEIPVSIFNVPKTLLISHSISYVPQQIAIGPYHYFTPEHYEMERYKIAAAKKIQKDHRQNLKFHQIVDQVKKFDQKIRAYYHRYLNFNGETLAWMMAVDASFLLEFLRIYAEKEAARQVLLTSMSHFIDIAGKKSAHNAVLRDIVMLENQIPLFLLRKVLEFQLSSLDLADELLTSMLTGFYEVISPFKSMEELPNIEVMTKSAHLLDFLYRTIVPKFEGGRCGTMETDQEQDEIKEGEENSFEKSSNVQKFVDLIWKALSKLDHGPVRIIKRIFFSKPIELMLKLPWTIISNFPGLKLLKQPIEKLFFPLNKEGGKEENDEKSKAGGNFEKPPLVEEINIPSVTELSKAGIRFVATYAGISSVNFDVKTRTFYLPVVCLDVNTEVLLRNLVAYETCSGSGQMIFTRYTELMNGIIDTEEDAKLLREKGIIVNHLKRDGEVAKLLNGMSRSIRLTKVEFLDKAIGDVNKCYNGRFKVKFKKFVNKYVFGSWKILTFLAAILMLFLMAVQAFCSVYSCPRIFNRVQNFQ